MDRLNKFATLILFSILFLIPIEHKYDKLFRHLSYELIPSGIEIHGIEKKIYFYATDIGAILLFILSLFALKIPLKRLFFQGQSTLLWIFFAFILASILASSLSNYAVLYTRLIGIFTAFFLFSFLSLPENRTLTYRLLAIFVASAFLQSFIAIAQYFLQSPLGLKIFSEPQIPTGGFIMQGGARWIFDSLFDIPRPSFIMRVSGTMHHCNVLGSFLALSLLAAYSIITTAKTTWMRNFLGLSLSILFFAMCLTYSRSAIFGWAIGTLVWFGFAALKKGFSEIAKDKNFRFLSFSILLSVLISGALLHNQFINRGGIVNYENSLAQGSDSVRLKSQAVSLQVFKKHPILGVGYQQYVPAASHLLPKGEKADLPHNIYLLTAVETGAISLLVFLSFIGVLLIRAIRSPFSPKLASLLGIFSIFLFVGCCDFTPLFLQAGRLMFFVSAALLAAESHPLKWNDDRRKIIAAS